jgi:hypothetical protein
MAFPPPTGGPVTRSSLTQLQRAMQTYFTAYGVNAAIYVGLKYRSRWDESRVVIIDGEFDGTKEPKPMNAGSWGAPWQKHSTNPRELFSWPRPITFSILGVDPANLDSEQAQIEAAELLIEMTAQALWNANWTDPVTGVSWPIGQNNWDFAGSKATWMEPGSSTEQGHGKEFLITGLYKCVLYDQYIAVQTGTPALEKGPMLFPGEPPFLSGVNAEILSATGSNVLVGNLGGFCTPNLLGRHMTLSGCAAPANNGTFPILAFNNPTSLIVQIASGVFPDANSGSIDWQIVP